MPSFTALSEQILRPGDTVTTNTGKVFEIEKYLGGGVTAEVYRAVMQSDKTPVAMKVLRPGSSPTINGHFWSEEDVLNELSRALKSKEAQQPTSSTNGNPVAAVPLIIEHARQREGCSWFQAL